MADLLTKGLDAPASAAPATAVKLAPEGLVTAIVAVTGVVDAVDDLIVPGAFAHTLGVRKPKVVFQHQWTEQVGRVLHVEEWMPGDARLPAKTKDGKPWPAAAGALVATMQFNMRSPRASEQWEMVRFYAESNEAEFSIGYKVPPGKARTRRDGVRVILQVDLYEFSHVLFGAAPLSMALDVKSAPGLHAGAAGTITRPTLAPADEAPYPTPPPIDATQGWDDDEPATKASASWRANAGNPENLRKWYAAGADGAIAWGTPGDFNRCVAIASEHMSPEEAKGYCNLRHHDALGIYPATHAAAHKAATTPPEAKTAAAVLADLRTPATAIEEKSMTYMTGSHEERAERIRDAARALFCKDTDTNTWVCVRATFDTEVIVTVETDGEEKNYLIGYTDTGGAIELDQPTEVELNVVAQVAGDDPKPADDAAVDDALATQLMSNLMQVKALAMVAGVTSNELRAEAESLFVELGGKSMPHDEEDDEDADTTTAAPAPQAPPAAPAPTEAPPAPPAPAPVPPAPTEPLPDDQEIPDEAPTGAPDVTYAEIPEPIDPATGPIDTPETPEIPDDEDEDMDPEDDDNTADTEDTETPGDDDERVTIDPDEHFAILESLGDDEDDTDDEDAA